MGRAISACLLIILWSSEVLTVGEIDVCPNRLLNLLSVQVIDEERVRKRIRLELADVMLIPASDRVVDRLERVAEIVCITAHCVPTVGIAVFKLIDTVALAPIAVVELRGHAVVEWRVPVSIPRADGVVIVGRILYHRIIPSISDTQPLEFDMLGASARVCFVLRLKVFGKAGYSMSVPGRLNLIRGVSIHWTIVAAIGLRGQVYPVPERTAGKRP